ncbi:arsenate reductase family protein [Nonlabens marinus]|uniref:Arsenate reductase n=1 Tax=Nonlabens marinus S1-08 TaxID=1454201 RepID=W8VXQ4_9FLAO|nr:hypothetical protein [Nonlabens marinus]BAO56332.1 hypothetical protein NMS_2323 [Nonlabens marinus S1-08]
MISIATDEREIVLLYNSDIKNHREIFAYAQSADVKLNALDITKEKITGTLWSEIANLLGREVKDLLHMDHSTFVQKHGDNVTLDNDGAIKLLQHEPELFIFPIAIKGKRAIEAHLYGDITELFGNDTSKIHIP